MKNIVTYFGIIVFVLGAVVGAGKLMAQSAQNEKKTDQLEAKVEAVTKDSIEIKTSQSYLKEKTDKIDSKLDKLTDIMISVKEDTKKK